MDEPIALIALSRLRGINNILKKDIVEKFDTITSFFEKKVKIFDDGMRSIASSFKGWKKLKAIRSSWML